LKQKQLNYKNRFFTFIKIFQREQAKPLKKQQIP
jgi:hypothetical protein